jgi:hypothetical protein
VDCRFGGNDLGECMPRRCLSCADVRPFSALNKALLGTALIILVLVGLPAQSKDVPLTAIELFDGPDGASYVQMTGLLINGKAEVRSCGGSEEISKSTYGKLTKIPLASATSLERDARGVMTLSRGGAAECVVPSNLKYDKDESLTASQLADRAVLQGQVLSSSPAGLTALPPFKPGVKLVFVSAADTELAEYLRSERSHSIAQWQDYLGRYAKAAHTDSAKQSLAALLEKEGEDGLASYRKSASSASPSYSDLKTAELRADQCQDLVPSYDAALKLRDSVRSELVTIAEKSRAELQAYKSALSDHKAGYTHLANARQLTDRALEVDPHFDQGQALQASILAESNRVDTALRTAESMVAAQHFDDAAAAVADFRAFAAEEPRIAAVIDAAYKYHSDRGKGYESEQKWHDAMQEYQKASDLKQTPEVLASLKRTQSGLETTQTRAGADLALQQSAEFEQDKRYIDAYEVLADLPDAQRKLVQDKMQELESNYVKNASEEAKRLQEAHTPIRGRTDEVGVQKAREYLRRASGLQPEDQNLKLRLDLVSNTLSDYYVQQAKRYLDKPLGSGVGVAWLYLDEAQQYQSNRDDVRDERTKSASIHNVRSTLSIKVVFRDQTSRRDSSGFADQLSDSIATGLETTALPVKVKRAADATPVEPNFQLIGDVLEHRPVSNVTVEPAESEYRAGERELPNDDWNKANRDYEAASLDLQNAQKVLEGAQAHGKKKDISTATTAVEDAQKKVEEAHQKLDAIPKTILVDVSKPYTYTKKTINLTAVVELGFRIVDASGNTVGATPSIKRTAQKPFVVLENVKPEDTKGVKQAGSPPDEMQFLYDVEVDARDALIKDVKEKVDGLPSKILAQARRHVSDGDADGAAEGYILYLNSTPNHPTAERDEARKFLKEQLNIVWSDSSAS